MPAPTSENMALAGANGNIWQVSRGALYNTMPLQGYPAFLTASQQFRLERIRQARMLYHGQHRDYFLVEERTSFDYPYTKVQGLSQRMYLTYNILGLISVKTTDLLFGQSPLLDCDDSDQWDALQALARRTNLHAVLIDAAVMGSAEGETFLEAIVHTDGKVYVQKVDSESIFPIGDIGPDGQYSSYVRYQLRNAGTAATPIWLLLETTIAPGKISRVCYQLNSDLLRSKLLSVEVFDASLSDAPTITGIQQNTIVWVPNMIGKALSDYDCAIPLQDDLNACNTRIKRVLGKHGDPKLAVPRAAADPQGNVPVMADTWFFDDPAEVPKYITWDANLASAIQDRAETLNNLLVRTETSPVLLGFSQGAAPQAYKSLRLQSFNSLTKAARKSVVWTSAVQQILDVAMALENTLPGISYSTDPVGVTLRDGIPIDDAEQANTISVLRSAGVMSRRRAVRIQLGDEAATDAELAEIDKDNAAATPSVLIHGDGPSPSPDAVPSGPAEEVPAGDAGGPEQQDAEARG